MLQDSPDLAVRSVQFFPVRVCSEYRNLSRPRWLTKSLLLRYHLNSFKRS